MTCCLQLAQKYDNLIHEKFIELSVKICIIYFSANDLYYKIDFGLSVLEVWSKFWFPTRN